MDTYSLFYISLFVFISTHTNSILYVSYTLIISKSFACFPNMVFYWQIEHLPQVYHNCFLCRMLANNHFRVECICNSFRFHFYTVCSEMSLTYCGLDNRIFHVFFSTQTFALLPCLSLNCEAIRKCKNIWWPNVGCHWHKPTGNWSVCQRLRTERKSIIVYL